jgi:WD40 repeat protein
MLLQSGGSIASSLRGHAANLTKVRFIATDSLVTGDDAGQLRLWRLLERRWTSLAFPQGHTGSVSALAVLRLADDLGDLVVSGSSDGVLRIWRARGGRVHSPG